MSLIQSDPATLTSPTRILIPPIVYGATYHRIEQYAVWCEAEAIPWYRPDLARYRDYLLERLAVRSVRSHLATIRSRYRDLLLESDLWWDLVELAAQRAGETLSPEQMILRAGELQKRVSAAIDPRKAPVKVTTSKDKRDAERVWLTAPQARVLLRQPDGATLRGRRDRAILALGLFLGLRDFELAALRYSDLFQTLNGAPAVWVRHGKGDAERLIPWGSQLWARSLVQDYLGAAGLTPEDDPLIFRGLDRWGNVSADPLSTRGVMRVAESYPVQIGRERVRLTWYVLRRTYARLCYEAGMPVSAIQANLGHESPSMTWHYIGPVDQEARNTPSLLDLKESD